MPNNEENPFPTDHPMHAVFESAGPATREVLREEIRVHRDNDDEPIVEKTPPLPKGANKYAPSAWAAPLEEDFTVPSGGVIRLRRVEILDLLGGGLLNKLDFMTSIVSEHAENVTANPVNKEKIVQTAGRELFADKERQKGFSEVMEKVVMRVVVQPQLWPSPPAGEERVRGCFYVDQVPFQDKTAIFNWAVTGKNQEGLTQFREESGESVGTVEPGQDVSVTSVELPDSP